MTAGPMVSAPAPAGVQHEALFYRTPEEYGGATARFIRAGLEAGDPVLAAVPGRAKIELLRSATAGAERVRFADMTEVGRNPARIIPFVRRFADEHAGRRIWFVGEPIWPDRSDAEYRECVRHEALLNTAFAGAAVAIFCPYDVAGLDQLAIADAWRTHPVLIDEFGSRSSPRYTDPAVLYAAEDRPLPDPPADAEVFAYHHRELHRLRRLVLQHARVAGLGGDRADDLLVAVNEVATNTLAHTSAGGTLWIWQDPASDGLICELRDTGRIVDPLVGRRVPSVDAEQGRGLWLANQFCDLVELRSGDQGTAVRLHAPRN
jgi:anti-sigma regulatory factor (Ser/Thr protein kinase)